MLRDRFGCHNQGEILLASSGKSPGMLVNIPQCAGQPLITNDYLDSTSVVLLRSAAVEKSKPGSKTLPVVKRDDYGAKSKKQSQKVRIQVGSEVSEMKIKKQEQSERR